ncbi:class I SAM-dependent methyltransferase [Eubacteriales bacterium OttesenSCG-928-K08]|nr:class I SAM-dependent methyltransferase [Eubacteriales bacterium OttesenSCG-928-K08]
MEWDYLGERYWDKRNERQRWVHDYILYPELLARIKELKSRYVLDYGCGDGSFAKFIANYLPDTVINAYDTSVSMQEIALQNIGEKYIVQWPTTNMYDAICMNMVLQDIERPCDTLRELYKCLQKNGFLLSTVPHPVFSLIESRHVTTTRIRRVSDLSHKDIYRYLSEEKETVIWAQQESLHSSLYNRTLSTYSQYFKQTGYTIASITEPLPKVSDISVSQEPDLMNIHSALPSFMVFVCQKI